MSVDGRTVRAMHIKSALMGAGGTVAVAAGVFFAVVTANAEPAEVAPEPVETARTIVHPDWTVGQQMVPPVVVAVAPEPEPTPEPVEEPVVVTPEPKPEPAPAPAPEPAPEKPEQPEPAPDASTPPYDLDLGAPPEEPPARDLPGGRGD